VTLALSEPEEQVAVPEVGLTLPFVGWLTMVNVKVWPPPQPSASEPVSVTVFGVSSAVVSLPLLATGALLA
jgi:hypothetical protein